MRNDQVLDKPPLSCLEISQFATIPNNTCENNSNFQLLQFSHVFLEHSLGLRGPAYLVYNSYGLLSETVLGT